MWVA
jgi:hypothetical protein